MLFKATLTLLAATLAVAAPSKRQDPEPDHRDLVIYLTNSILAVTETYDAFGDGTPVGVNSTLAFDIATVRRPDIGIPEYHCELFNKRFTAIGNYNPGSRSIDPPSLIGLIICDNTLAEKKNSTS